MGLRAVFEELGSGSARGSCLGALLLLSGCAVVEPAAVAQAPDSHFAGVVAPGDVRGERSVQVMGAIETRVLQSFPRANWLAAKSRTADVLLDLNVYSARTTDSRSSQEVRNCRRWSEPEPDARGALKRLLSRSCLDWQVQQVPCLTRTYEADMQIRAVQGAGGRVIASDRKVFSSSERQCGDQVPAVAALQAKSEAAAAAWAVDVLRSPLAQLAASGAAAPSAVPAAPAVAATVPLARPPEPQPALPPLAPARSVEAHALVIGNAGYPGSARLANPLNDASAIARKLSELGFQVTRIDDGDRRALVSGLSQFQQKAAKSEVTVLYYSGHGMQMDGVNYLLPVDIDASKPATFRLQAMPLDLIIDTYLPGRTRVVFLDACRDNPLLSASVRGFNRGLAAIQVPTGTLIAYATRDGGVAEDGTGRHSPFTQAILDHIGDPEDISLVLRKVRDRVMRETGGRQQPWEYGSLSGGALVFSQLRGN